MIDVKQEGDFIWITENKFSVDRINFISNLINFIDAELIDYAIEIHDLASAVSISPTTEIPNIEEAFDSLKEFDQGSNEVDDDQGIIYNLSLLFYKHECSSHHCAIPGS